VKRIDHDQRKVYKVCPYCHPVHRHE
jgi:hypothetical protein